MFKKLVFFVSLFVLSITGVNAQDFKGVYFDDYDISNIFIGDSIGLTFERNDDREISDIVAYFMGENYVSASLEDVNDEESYFIVSEYFKEGTKYSLTLLSVTYEDGEVVNYGVGNTSSGNLESLKTNYSEIKINELPEMTKFSLVGPSSVDINGELEFEISYTGDIDFASVYLSDSKSGVLLPLKINGNRAIVDLSNTGTQNLHEGDYYVSDLFLNPNTNSGYVHYSVNPDDYTASQMKKIKFTLTNENNIDLDLDEELDDDIDLSQYEFNLDDFNDDVNKILKLLDDDATITLNIEDENLVSSKIFESIINTNRKLIIKSSNVTWLFDGKDIINPKMIDVNVKILDLSKTKDEFLKKSVSENSIILNFAENGKLPGKVTIKINKNLIDIDSDKLYIYYYDEKNDKLVLLKSGLKEKGNSYEFVISHNSKYIITDEKLEDVDKVETIGKTNKVDKKSNIILYIVLIVIIIIIVTVSVIVIKKRKNKDGKKELKKEKNEFLNTDLEEHDLLKINTTKDEKKQPTDIEKSTDTQDENKLGN